MIITLRQKGIQCQIIPISISVQPLLTHRIMAGRFGKPDHEPTFGDACIAHRVIGPAVRELYTQRQRILKTTPKTYVGLLTVARTNCRRL